MVNTTRICSLFWIISIKHEAFLMVPTRSVLRFPHTMKTWHLYTVFFCGVLKTPWFGTVNVNVKSLIQVYLVSFFYKENIDINLEKDRHPFIVFIVSWKNCYTSGPTVINFNLEWFISKWQCFIRFMNSMMFSQILFDILSIRTLIS